MGDWTSLTTWLTEQVSTHLEETSWSVSTQTAVLLPELMRHREFQRELGIRAGAFDDVRRRIGKLRDRAPRDDHAELDRMLAELKHLWNVVCTKSLEK